MFIYIILSVLLALVFAAIWLIDGTAVAEKTFVCNACGKHFSPKWWKAGFSVHMGEHTVLRCPHCKTKDFCPPAHE